MMRKLVQKLAARNNRVAGLYKRFARPDGKEWAEYLRERGELYHLGVDCSILVSTRIIDPSYTWLGDRVCLGSCTLVCHDGSVQMLEQRYGVKLDHIGPIVIENDCFVGEGAYVLGGTTVGEGSIVGAGCVLRQSIPAGSVAIGNPGKVVARVEDMLRFWEAESLSYPWADLIAQRQGSFDRSLEPELHRMRQEHFFKPKGS